jgi:hypothetical protein
MVWHVEITCEEFSERCVLYNGVFVQYLVPDRDMLTPGLEQQRGQIDL